MNKQENQQCGPMRKGSTKGKLYRSIAIILALCAMLGVTTYALFMPSATVENNLFQMAAVEIELGQEGALFNAANGNIEPGKTLVEELTIVNPGQVDIYYRLYLEHVAGELQDDLQIRVYHGQQLLFQGTADELTLDNPCKDTQALAPGEERTLSVQVYMPKGAGNQYQTQGLEFDIKVDGVQAKNNPGQRFD